MITSKLWQILSVLTREEWNKLREFVESPYFNRRGEVVRLLYALEQVQSGVPDRQAIFGQIFPGKPFSDHRLRQSMSFLLQLAYEFLEIHSFRADLPGRLLLRSGALRRRGLNDRSADALSVASGQLQDSPLRNADYHDLWYRIELDSYKTRFERIIPGATEMQKLSDSLDVSYITRKLWQACFLWSHQQISGASYDYGLLPAVTAYVEQYNLTAIPAVGAYYYCYLALTGAESDISFERFIGLLQQENASFTEEEIRDLYLLALNFCIRKVNTGSKTYLPFQFELYRSGISGGYFTTEGGLSRHTYLNAVTTALALREYDWAIQFTDGYSQQLPAAYRKPLWQFNHARLAFARGKNDRALELLRDVEIRDTLLMAAIKTVQIKIFHETGNTDLLESNMQALQTFIRRRKAGIGYHQVNYLNMIRLLRRRMEIPDNDRDAIKRWIAQVQDTPDVAEKDWLISLRN
ncbi:MAG: hypothetical protein RJA20_2663 [Bacteroidota bacterium]|jgi:hypothetical protein